MLKGYERRKGEDIDVFMERVNSEVEMFRAASIEVQGPNMQIASDGHIIVALQLGKMEAVRTPQGAVPSFRPFTRDEVKKRLDDKREGKGPFRIPGN